MGGWWFEDTGAAAFAGVPTISRGESVKYHEEIFMKRIAMSIVALACMCCFVANVNAGGECCKSKATGTTVAEKSGCCKGESEFPTMTMMVGDKKIGCPVEAEKVATESKSKVIYVVDGEKYECKEKAYAALADAAEVYADHFTTVACVVNGNPIYCDSMSKGGCSEKAGATKVAAKSEGCCKAGDKAKTGQSETTKVAAKGGEGHGQCTGDKAKSGETTKVAAKSEAKEEGGCCMSKAGANVKYMVLGKTFDKMADAEKARDEVLAAVKKVNFKAVVDGKEVACDEVCPNAEKAGKVTYMVNGEKVECKTKARIMTAKAKYEAAKGAMDKKMAKA